MASAALREDEAEPAGAEMVRQLLSHSARARSHAAAHAALGSHTTLGSQSSLGSHAPLGSHPPLGSQAATLGAGPSAAPRAARPYLAPLPEAPPAGLPNLEVAALEAEIARLEAELHVVRAALRAEQDEVASLRADLDRATYAPVGDIRGDRDRWASLVERLLFAER